MLHKSDFHSYQNKAIEFIIQRRKCALFIDMGMGKTASSATAFLQLYNDFFISKILIVAPLEVVNNVWNQEFKKWSHLKDIEVLRIVGNASQKYKALHTPAIFYAINRENLQWLVKNHAWDFDAVIIDESSSFKNHDSQRFKSLRAVLPKIKAIVCMTGTPEPNGYHDLWSQIYLLDQGMRLGRNITAFRNRWFSRHFKGFGFNINEGAEIEINDKIKDICLSMEAKDYLNLPDKIEVIEHVELPKQAFETYTELEKEFITVLHNEKDIEALSAAALGNKLLQLCNGCIYGENKEVYHVHNAKVERLKDIIADNPTESILIAYNYQSDIEMLRKAIPSIVFLKEDKNAVEEWNTGKIKYLAAHPASASYGLNLQHGGSMIVWYGLNWSLEYYQQFNARLHRQGQNKPVRIIYLVAKGCIDQKVMEVIKDKAKVQQSFIDYMKDCY
jgi:SNF2 family DNA or RNA helicase